MSFLQLARQATQHKGSAYVALSIAASSLGVCEYSRSRQPPPPQGGNENESSSSSSSDETSQNWTLLLDRAFQSPRVLCDSASMTSSVVASSAVTSVAAGDPSDRNHNPFTLRRRATLARMNLHSTKHALETKYEINPEPIGEGAFGQVFVARHRQTGELVAVKRIWKKYSDNQDFVREMSTLLQIQAHGGHPHICQLRENFEQADDYALVLDLIKGGEMFEHLVESGAYSELDASRLIREVASALAFMHGIGLVHGDLKPENIMLNSKNESASVKLVDFGCTEHLPGFEEYAGSLDLDGIVEKCATETRTSGGTVAYSPPESFDGTTPIDAPLDMWALGIILHIMLTGFHPFDRSGDADDDMLQSRISTLRRPPLDTPDTQHLSESAMDLLRRLLEPDPKTRLTAHEMLEHSWIRGETAKADVMKGSDQKLSNYRKFRSKIETHVFQELMSWSENKNRSDPSKNGDSLVEKAFKSMDKGGKGFLNIEDISKDCQDEMSDPTPLTLSSFSDLLGANMQNKYFPAGHVVFQEGDKGDHMYFLNSGTCEVSTKDGFHHILKHGDTFGEGGLINENGKRSATIRTVTPVHAIQIDRECFQKYLLGSSSALALKIKERVNKRKFGRAEYIVGEQKNLLRFETKKGGKIYSDGDKADSLFFVVDGMVDVRNDGLSVYHACPGELFGVQSFYFNRSRDADAVCITDRCVVKEMNAHQFKELATSNPELEKAVHEMALRREFQRAIVRKLKGSFDVLDLQEVFNAIDLDHTGRLNREGLRDLLTHLDFLVSDTELRMLFDSLDLDGTGGVNFEEFSTLFAS